MAFRGWPAEAFDFFDGLEADNSKAYWEEHKALYQDAVKGPMEALLAELEPEFGAGRIFRPYRDVRFSKDKSPYKTNIAAHLGDAGYVTLWSGGLGVGSGTYQMAPDQLDRYRRAVDDDATGTALEAIGDELRAAGHELVAHGSLKTAPRGYLKDHPRIELLRAKGITTWHEWEPAAWMGTKKAKDRIAEVVRAAGPLEQWLASHVGETTMEDAGR